MRRSFGANLWFPLAASLIAVGCGNEASNTAPSATATASAPPKASAMPMTTGSAATTASAASSANAPPDTSVVDAEKAGEELKRHHRHHHHGGVPMFISMAIDTLGVPADKKDKLEKIQSDLHAKLSKSREAAHEVLELLEKGVEAGKVDKAKVDAAIKKQEAQAKDNAAASEDALNKLHALLAPEERQALVDKIRAHEEVWKKVNHDEPHSAKEKGTLLHKTQEDLKLTNEQVDKIEAALKKDAPPKPEAKEIDSNMKELEEAFTKDKFDAKSLAKSENAANVHISHTGTARIARFYEAVAPVLNPEQRKKLADELKERLNDKHAAK